MLPKDDMITIFFKTDYVCSSILAWSFPWNEIFLQLALSTDDLSNWTFFQFIIEQTHQNFVQFVE